MLIQTSTHHLKPIYRPKRWVQVPSLKYPNIKQGKTKGGAITVPFTSCLTGLDYSVLQIKTKIVSCHTANS
jgi:hypothetical protein